MGLENSKFDTSHIERNLNQLLRRLDQNNENCDKYVIRQIQSALILYSNQLNKLANDKIPKNKKDRLKCAIERAINKLDQIPSRQNPSSNYNNYSSSNTSEISCQQKQLEKIEIYRKDILKALKRNQMSSNERDQHLKILTEYSQQLDQASKIKNDKLMETRKNISILFLELFAFETPSRNRNQNECNKNDDLITDKKTLENVIVMLRNLSIQNHKHNENNNLDMFNEIEASVKAVQKIVATLLTLLDTKRKQIINEDYRPSSTNERQRHAYNPSVKRMNQTGNLNKTTQSKTLEKDNFSYKNGKTKLSRLKTLQNTPISYQQSHVDPNYNNNEEANNNMKGEIHVDPNHNNNEEANNNMKGRILKVDDPTSLKQSNISSACCNNGNNILYSKNDSIIDYHVKNKGLTQENEDNITEIINSHLHLLTKEIQEFNQTSNSYAYKQKIDKIVNLESRLKDMQVDKNALSHLHQLRRDIEQKATQKDKEMECSNNLNNIENRVKSIFESNLNVQSKISKLEIYKKCLKSIDTTNHALTTKKTDIFDKIQSIQNKFLIEKSKEDLWRIKSNFEKYREIYMSKSVKLDVEGFKKLIEEIVSSLEHLKNMPKLDETSESNRQKLYSMYDELLKSIEKKVIEKEECDKCLEELRHIEEEIAGIKKSNSSQLKTKRLEQCKSKICTIKNHNKVVASKKAELLENLQKSKAKFNLSESLRNNMWKIKSSIDKYKIEVQHFRGTISSNSYKCKRDEISNLREAVEKISQENKIIEEEKHHILLEIEEILKTLQKKAKHNEEALEKFNVLETEESFQNIETNNNHESSNIVDMQQYFDDFDLKSISVPRDSFKFIETIKQMAENFENQIQNYKGTNYSTQYFIIDEKLMLLIEELDKLKSSNEEMLQEKIKAIKYIKSLQEQLDQNATED